MVSRLSCMGLALLLAACATRGEKTLDAPARIPHSIGELKNVRIELKDEVVEDTLEKAMQSYQRVLDLAPDVAITPQAMLRLADLKMEMEQDSSKGTRPATGKIEPPAGYAATRKAPRKPPAAPPGAAESDQAFEKRATASSDIPSGIALDAPLIPAEEGLDADPQETSAREAIAIYRKFLEKYPAYERRDQVLYQLSRSYEEAGDIEASMNILEDLVREYPGSRYLDEFQLRRGEYYFTRRKFLDAEEAYRSIVNMGPSSSYFELALYKLGWSFYKQELYQDALDWFFVLLDYKESIGYEFERTAEMQDEKRIEDTYRVLSLIFSNLGGPDAVEDYISRTGSRPYETSIYRSLGVFYLDKRRYSDAASAFQAFAIRHPLHVLAPQFDMRAIEMYIAGGFPRLVIDAYKDFVEKYGLNSDYWKKADMRSHPDAQTYLKSALKELANHYHARFQDKRLGKEKGENSEQAIRWYREFLTAFPKDTESPILNYQLAQLLLENRQLRAAADEFERTAYKYPPHDKAATAAYALIYTQREELAAAPPDQKDRILRDIIGHSWKFSDAFGGDARAPAVLGAAVENIYGLKEYNFAIATGRRLLANFPDADPAMRRSTLLIIAHSMFESEQYADAEELYQGLLQATPENDPSRAQLTDNLAASIYRQGEQAARQGNDRKAMAQFQRVAQITPDSSIRPAADYDAAAAVVRLRDWPKAAGMLNEFRTHYPGHALQAEVSKNIAALYRETEKPALAAAEYERVETESRNAEMRREALLLAADLYVESGAAGYSGTAIPEIHGAITRPAPENSGAVDKALALYRRYADTYPSPLEHALEARYRIALILRDRNKLDSYLEELKRIVAADAAGGHERNDRTRYLAARSALVLAEPLFRQFNEIKLVQPFDQNLQKKTRAMKTARDALDKLLGYEAGEVTAAATYYLAEMYYGFSRALTESERPADLDAEEREQYELSIEEQAYPFEERAIQTHEKNLELMLLGIYNPWIEKSLDKLAGLVPARYAKFEESSGFIETIQTTQFSALTGTGKSRSRQTPVLKAAPDEQHLPAAAPRAQSPVQTP